MASYFLLLVSAVIVPWLFTNGSMSNVKIKDLTLLFPDPTLPNGAPVNDRSTQKQEHIIAARYLYRFPTTLRFLSKGNVIASATLLMY
jgi:hypothetical protein